MLAVLFMHRMNMRRRNADKQAASVGQLDHYTADGVYCRTCLSTDNLLPLFYNTDGDVKMSQNLKIVTGLGIKINDGLSQKICSKCLNIINFTIQFRRKSKRAEKTLLGIAAGTVNVKKKYSSVEDVKPKIKKPKDDDYDYDNTAYEDDFQNDNDFDSTDDVKPVVKEPKPTPGAGKPRQKALKIPNATSYKCSTCNKEFRMKATFKAHMRFHTNYCVCEACGKRCRNNNQLQEHKRARHGLGRIHKCAYCEYSSATKEALVIHERRHTGERPYICDHCGATFHRRSNLVQHIAVHLPDKNFQCTFCPAREKSKKRLQIHISKTHRVKRYSHRNTHHDREKIIVLRPYKCPLCLKLFQRNEHTHRHLSRVHRLPRAEHPPVERVLLLHRDVDTCTHPPPPPSLHAAVLHGC